MMKMSGIKILGLIVFLSVLSCKGWGQTLKKGDIGFFKEQIKGHDSIKDNTTGEVLYYNSNQIICSKEEITDAVVTMGEYTLKPVVRVRFNEKGRKAFAKATLENKGKRILIISNHNLLSAPVVNDEVSGGMVEISGIATYEEAQVLALVIHNGNSNPGKESSGSFGVIEEAVPALDKALLAGDETVLALLLHDDVTFGHSNGWIQDKKDVIYDLKKKVLQYTEIRQLDIEDGTHRGDMIGLRRKLAVKGTYKEDPFDLVLSVWEVWVSNNGKWQLWGRQSVKIK